MAPGDRVWAAIPDPITTAASMALPRNSASNRRHKTLSLTAPPISPVFQQQAEALVPLSTSALQQVPSPLIPLSTGASAKTV